MCMTCRKGDRYDGDWHMDKRHGDGDMQYMDGTVYEVSIQLLKHIALKGYSLQ